MKAFSKRHSNDNNKWKEANDLELEQIKEYQVFKDFGRAKAVYDKKHITDAPVFDVKHCGKFKARLLAGGHFTKEPMETVYPGMFFAELNNLDSKILEGQRLFMTRNTSPMHQYLMSNTVENSRLDF